MQQLTPGIGAALQQMMALANRGDLRSARALGEEAMRRFDGHGAILAMLGMICCRAGDFDAGIRHLRAALKNNPADPMIAADLTAALIETGKIEEAAKVCSEERAAGDPSARLWWFRGYVLQQLPDHAGAVRAYEQVVARNADDFESWNNLGNARVAAGDPEGAIEALQRAASLAPDVAPVQLNLAAALSDTGRLEDAADVLGRLIAAVPDDPKPLIELATVLRHLYRDAEALDTLERAVAVSPADADLLVQLGEERAAAWRFDDAEQALRDALSIDPRHAKGYVQLALMLEHMNREAEFPDLLAAAEKARADEGVANFIRVLICRREQQFEEGLRILEAVPPDIEPIRRAQLEGQFRDRIGDSEGAFAAFVEMNRLFELDSSNPVRRAETYRSMLHEGRATVKPQWFAGWPKLKLTQPTHTPVFLVGFPRSGTTLLDTMLMGHPDVQVLEERPPLRRVEDALGGVKRIAEIDAREVTALRARYFSEVADYVDLRPGSLLVDKSPLHMTRVPLIHRLFPEARFILALRHPCDVVLSCFITGFQLNNAMSNFLDLETGAHFYDDCFSYWEQCRTAIPIQVHNVVYERMIENSEAELRPLFDFLELGWHEEVLDHRRTAAERGLISTASYAQVIEPIYRRASGRWERYRDQLAPVLPVLKPWVDRFGYTL